MKSIKQQYIDLTESKMSQANFMRNVRMTLPHLVTNITSFKDTVKILKNKGILSEILSEKNLDVDQEELKKGIEVEKEHTNDPVKAEEIALDHLKEDPKYYSKLSKAGLEEEIDEPKDDNISPEELDAIIKKYEEEESGKYTTGGEQFPIKPVTEAKAKWENANGKSMYSQFKDIDNINGEEYMIGMHYEYEWNPGKTKEEYQKIVLKNIKKNPDYYTNYKLTGIKDYKLQTMDKTNTPEVMAMKPVKGEDSLVDKSRGMKPVKGVEKIKASANKASKETNKLKKGTISLMSLVAKASRGVEKMVATGEKMKVVKESNDSRELSKKIAGLGINAEKWDKMSPNEKLYAIDSNRFVPKGSRLKAAKMSWDELVQEFDGIRQGFAFPTEPKSIKPGIGDAIQRKITKEDLMELIRKELKETFDGRDNLTDVTGENK